jgi:hypothetical protein
MVAKSARDDSGRRGPRLLVADAAGRLRGTGALFAVSVRGHAVIPGAYARQT